MGDKKYVYIDDMHSCQLCKLYKPDGENLPKNPCWTFYEPFDHSNLDPETLVRVHCCNLFEYYREEKETKENEETREQLAAYAHEAWSGWMKYLFDKSTLIRSDDGKKWESATIPGSLVERWMRQMNTRYADLPENEKNSDKEEADRMLAIFNKDK